MQAFLESWQHTIAIYKVKVNTNNLRLSTFRKSPWGTCPLIPFTCYVIGLITPLPPPPRPYNLKSHSPPPFSVCSPEDDQKLQLYATVITSVIELITTSDNHLRSMVICRTGTRICMGLGARDQSGFTHGITTTTMWLQHNRGPFLKFSKSSSHHSGFNTHQMLCTSNMLLLLLSIKGLVSPASSV